MHEKEWQVGLGHRNVEHLSKVQLQSLFSVHIFLYVLGLKQVKILNVFLTNGPTGPLGHPVTKTVPVARRFAKEDRRGREDAKERVRRLMTSVVLLLRLRRLRRPKCVTLRTAARQMDNGAVVTGNVSAKISCVTAIGTARGVRMRNLAPVLEY